MVPEGLRPIAKTSFTSSRRSKKLPEVTQSSSIVLLEVLLEFLLVLLDEKRVVGLLKCPSPTHKSAL